MLQTEWGTYFHVKFHDKSNGEVRFELKFFLGGQISIFIYLNKVKNFHL